MCTGSQKNVFVCMCQYQGVGLEFSRGEAFEVQVGLELAVILFRGAALLVEGDQCLVSAKQSALLHFFDRRVPG